MNAPSGSAELAGQARPGAPPTADALLADHCRRLDAEGAALLAVRPDGRVDILAIHPPPAADPAPPDWLTVALHAAGQVAAGTSPVARGLHRPDDLYGSPPGRHVLLRPVAGPGGTAGVLAFAGRTDRPDELAAAVERLDAHLAADELYGLLLAAAAPRPARPEFADAIALLAKVNEPDRLLPAAMALCNEAAARWRCERAALGFAVSGSVRLAALSHTEQFNRRGRAVQLIEAAMDECLDQDVEVLYPAPASAAFICRAAAELASEAGRTALACLPLRREGEPFAALLLERDGARPFSPGEVESLRLGCELIAPRLGDLHRNDRWVGARAAGAVRRAAAGLVGPRHTWAKLLALLLAAGVLYAALAFGEHRLAVPFVLRPMERQVVPAPFDGQVEAVLVDVGERVAPGRALARMQTVTLERRRNALRAELFEQQKQADTARSAKRWAEAQVAAARARQLAEQIDLLAWQIDQAVVRANLAGTVVAGDARDLLGSAVRTGQVLFEIQTVDRLRAELAVPEADLADLLDALARGAVPAELATASFPDRPIPCTVHTVLPLGRQTAGRVVFTARADVGTTPEWARPGMAGVAHITLGRRRLAWLWTRPLVERLRLWLWR